MMIKWALKSWDKEVQMLSIDVLMNHYESYIGSFSQHRAFAKGITTKKFHTTAEQPTFTSQLLQVGYVRSTANKSILSTAS